MIRLTSLELEHFKNTEYGKAHLSSWKQGGPFPGADVAGIYGQNGSGKTSVIQALAIARNLFLGRSIDECAQDCVSKASNSMAMTIEGAVFNANQEPRGLFRYKVEIIELENKVSVDSESLFFKDLEKPKPTMRNLFSYSASEGGATVAPKIAWESLISLSTDVRADFAVAQRISCDQSKSLLFSSELIIFLGTLNTALENAAREGKLSKEALKAASEVMLPFFALRNQIEKFAFSEFAVVNTARQAGPVSNLLLVSTHEDGLGKCANASFYVDLTAPCAMTVEHCQALEKSVSNISTVLGALVPGLELGVTLLDKIMLDNGNIGVRVEITCTRDGVTVPLRCESGGIKRLVSILTPLIDVYAKPGSCVAIDELDSGISEFLLGEILQVLQEHGRGQLVFTAHNLRPLEVVDKNSLIFTTTNPSNRYVGFKGSRDSNNLRSQYLRALNLGGQPETMCDPTSKFDINAAFFDAADR